MHKTRDILRGWGHGAIELILFMPLILLLPVYLAPPGSLAAWLLLLPCFYLAGSLTVIGLGWRRKWQQAGAALVFSVLLSAGAVGTGLWGYITALLGVILFLRGVYMAYRKVTDIYPELFYFIGPALYFLTAIFYSRIEELKPYSTLMFWLGLLSLIICLAMSNRVHLQWTSFTRNRNQKNEGEQKLHKGMLLHNRILLVVLVLIIVLASLLRQIQQWLAWLYAAFIGWINDLLASGSEEPIPETQPEAPPMQAPGGLEQGEPAAFFVWLEKVVQVVFYVIMIALAGWLLFWLGKQAIRLAKWLTAWLNARMERNEDGDQGIGYTDEEEVLDGGWKPFGRDAAGRLQQWIEGLRNREPQWEALTGNREKARYLYRHYVKKATASGYPIRPSLTPQEAGEELAAKYPEEREAIKQLTGSYERVRYGDKEPETDLEQIRRELKLK